MSTNIDPVRAFRASAATLLLVVAFSEPAIGQWPKGGTSKPPQSQEYTTTGGCAVSPAQLPVLLSSIRYTIYFPNDDADAELFRGITNADRLMSRVFDVDVTYGVYHDEAPNAFATATDIAEVGESDGTVLIGRKLVAEEKKSNPRLWTASVTFVLAHEYAHILQFKRGTDVGNPHLELHADYLAGWWLGQENAKMSPYYTNMAVVNSSLLAKGSYAFNSPQFHGTPRQRREALRIGYEAGESGVSLDEAFDEGLGITKAIVNRH